MSTDDRFWSKVDTSGTCWEWTGGRRGGYGLVTRNYRSIGAHRYSWELAHGPVPAGRVVCHRCDNRACVNPTHLFLGTQQQNIDDMVSKGRHLHGERHHSARLTERLVLEIRRQFDAGASITSLARKYGYSKGLVFSVARRKTWKHLEKSHG